MHFQLLFFVGVALLLSLLQVCNCSNISEYTKCSKKFECGGDAYSYPFWGNNRSASCGIKEFRLECRNSQTQIDINSRTYRVFNIDVANQIMTIVRSEVWYLRDSKRNSCSSGFLSGVAVGSGSPFEYAPGTLNYTLFYGCSFNVSAVGGDCYYLAADSIAPNKNTSECQGSIRIPVRPSSVNLSTYEILLNGFDAKYAGSYYSDCVNCTNSGGSCGSYNITFQCYCRDGTSQRKTCLPPDKKRDPKVIIIIIVIVGIITISVCAYWCWRRMAKQREKKSRNKNMISFNKSETVKESSMTGMLGDNLDLPRFSFEMLAIATNDFSFINRLGQGGFGSVYKGILPGPDEREVAVKRLSMTSGQGFKEFKNEVIVISKLQHRNLVRLLGYCFEGDEKMLVYEYMPNKSLDFFLFGPVEQRILKWKVCFQIIEGIARGMLYLHRDSRLRVIHRDLKASNVLLDEQLNPKISDFGMARIFGGNDLQADTVRVVGTYGYMSPEYAMQGKFSEKSDVFSFGVLLLEIVTGKKNTSSHDYGESLSLLGYDFSDDRPTMSSVLSMLTSETAILPTPKEPVFTQTKFSSDPDSSQSSRNTYSRNKLTASLSQG
ncbi:hypothetical protein GIB67_018106, partial [Kingdonia uniflora]